LKIETRMNFPLRKVVLNLIKNHHRIYELYRNRDEIGFKAISRIVKDLDGHDLLLLLLDFADRWSRHPSALDFEDLDTVSHWFMDKKKELNISRDTIQPLVMGRDLQKLGMTPGRKMGAMLKKLYELQLDGEFDTKEQGIDIFKKLRRD